MGIVNKTLGQSNPGAVLTDLYTAPAGANTTANVTVCNVGVFAETYRIAVAPAGAASVQKHFIAFDTVIAANTSVTVSGIYLRAGDVLRVYGSTSNLSFVAMGTESV